MLTWKFFGSNSGWLPLSIYCGPSTLPSALPAVLSKPQKWYYWAGIKILLFYKWENWSLEIVGHFPRSHTVVQWQSQNLSLGLPLLPAITLPCTRFTSGRPGFRSSSTSFQEHDLKQVVLPLSASEPSSKTQNAYVPCSLVRRIRNKAHKVPGTLSNAWQWLSKTWLLRFGAL